MLYSGQSFGSFLRCFTIYSLFLSHLSFFCHILKEKGEFLCLIILTAVGVTTAHLAVATVTAEMTVVMIDTTTAGTGAMTATTIGLGANMYGAASVAPFRFLSWSKYANVGIYLSEICSLHPPHIQPLHASQSKYRLLVYLHQIHRHQKDLSQISSSFFP